MSIQGKQLMKQTITGFEIADQQGDLYIVTLQGSKQYNHDITFYCGFYNDLGFVPLVKILHWRQNAWNNRPLPCLTGDQVDQAYLEALDKLSKTVKLSNSEVIDLVNTRYRYKKAKNANCANVAREHITSIFADKSFYLGDFISLFTCFACYGAANGTQRLIGDSWKHKRIFNALCEL